MLILLDIDGVMIPASNWKVPALLSDGFPDFNSKAVASLNKILRETNASIVLTTSHKSLFSLEVWKVIFSTRGIHTTISKLPDAEKLQRRIDEVMSWIQSHPTEKDFVIIDDDKSLNGLPMPLKNRFVLTSSLVGLNDELADKAIEILKLPQLTTA